jgi:hypothetical protein
MMKVSTAASLRRRSTADSAPRPKISAICLVQENCIGAQREPCREKKQNSAPIYPVSIYVSLFLRCQIV